MIDEFFLLRSLLVRGPKKLNMEARVNEAQYNRLLLQNSVLNRNRPSKWVNILFITEEVDY